MAARIRSCLVALGLLPWIFPAVSDAQLGGLGRAVRRGAVKKVESDARDLLRNAARCVFDDAACIERAEREGRPVVLTGDQGEPLQDDNGRPITSEDQASDDASASPDVGGGRSYDFGDAPAGLLRAVERELRGGAPEIARQHDAALAALSAYRGAGRRPLDPAAAHASALHAARVYRSLDEIRRELGEGVHVAPLVTAISGLQYYVFDEGNRQVVAIRGTRPEVLRNWVANLVVRGARDDIIRLDVHEGFLLATRVIQASLRARLDKGRPIHLTGHSLGGSLATLFALRLDRLGYQVSVTTFGAPKITTLAAFANERRLHRLPLTRLVNAGDMVYHFPPTMDTTGKRLYAQFGREWMLTPDGACLPTNLGNSLRKSVSMMLDENLPAWSIDEHGMDTYLERLEALVEHDVACQAGDVGEPR